MIIPFPSVAANDNPDVQYWVCYACQSGGFVLESIEGVTTIHCASCNVDVTSYVAPYLKDIQCSANP